MNHNPSPAPAPTNLDALARLVAFRRVADDALRRRLPWLPLSARRELADEVIARVFALGRFDADQREAATAAKATAPAASDKPAEATEGDKPKA